MTVAERALRTVVAAICAAEAFAIATRKIPTVTSCCRRRRSLTPIVLAGIAAHLILPLTPPAVIVVKEQP